MRTVRRRSARVRLRAAPLAAALLAFHAAARADVHYVDLAGGNHAPFTNRLDAATSIQPALDAASPGDTVLVADGTYRGASNRSLKFNGKGLTLAAEPGTSPVIDCEASGPGFRFLLTGETTNACVAGLTIINGGSGGAGGGFFLYSTSPTISNCTIRSSVNDDGIGCSGSSSPIVRDCTITDMTMMAAVSTRESSRARIERCTFARCRTGLNALSGDNVIADSSISSNATGVYLGSSASLAATNCDFVANTDHALKVISSDGRSARAVRCRFIRNSSSESGGAVAGGPVTLHSCRFVGNWSGNRGGAVHSGNLSMSDCVVTNNSATWDGGGVAVNGSFTLAGCLVASNTAAQRNGGGVLLESSSGEISGCRVERCRAPKGAGGGIHAMWQSASRFLLRDTVITSNKCATTGAGLYIDRRDALVSNCVVSANTGGTRGGGVFIGDVCNVTLYRCTVASNQIPAGIDSCGGGVYCGSTSCRPRLINCVINHNAADWGGGIHSWSAETFITNCTVAWNRAYPGGAYDGGGLLAFFNPVQVANTIFWTNTPQQIAVAAATVATSYCCIQGGYPGVMNFDANPLFMDGPAGDLHLRAGSFCIDRAPSAGAPRDDRDGVPRGLDGDGDGGRAVDVGAYEYASSGVDADGDTSSDADEVIAGTGLLDPRSYLRVTTIGAAAGSDRTWIVWPGVPGRSYTVEVAAEAGGGWGPAPGGASLAGVSGDMTYTNPAPPSATGCYRVRAVRR